MSNSILPDYEDEAEPITLPLKGGDIKPIDDEKAIEITEPKEEEVVEIPLKGETSQDDIFVKDDGQLPVKPKKKRKIKIIFLEYFV